MIHLLTALLVGTASAQDEVADWTYHRSHWLQLEALATPHDAPT